MADYTVIGSVKSRTLRVLWMLEELSQPYTHVPVAPRDQLVRGHNPSGKIPVLLEGSTVLTDSTAIITYLADKRGALTEPAGTLARARQDSITQLILDEIEAPLWMAARHSFVLPEEKRMPAIKDSLHWEFAKSCHRLALRIGSAPFTCGDAMRVPDILLGHCLGWAIAARFPQEEDSLRTFLDRMRARPAFQRASAR